MQRFRIKSHNPGGLRPQLLRPRYLDDGIDIEIRLQRIVILTHLVGFVRLVAVRGETVFMGKKY